MRSDVRAFILGALLLPLSLAPFAVYARNTPEGRLIADRARSIVTPTDLPTIDGPELDHLRSVAPSYRGGVAILVYHGIGSGTSSEGSYNLSPDRFAEQVAALEAAGMEPVTMQEVARAWEEGRELPQNAVAVTFDDGRTDAMLFADRVLGQADWRATMYVITSRAGGTRSPYYVGWDRLREYHRSGRWDLQSHTADLHRMIETDDGRLPAMTAVAPGLTLGQHRRIIRADLEQSAAEIEHEVGVRPLTFAYPFGAYGAERTNVAAMQRVVRSEVARAYALAVHQDDQENPELATRCSESTGLRRIEVGDWSGEELVRRIALAVEATAACPAIS